jgi:hypothetical protein
MLIGDKQRSEKAFARGVKLAGSVEQAEALLGIPPEKQPNEKQADERAAQKTTIDPEQVRAMLKQAASTVLTVKAESASSNAAKSTSGKNQSAWRSAGPRASDGSETTQLLYWKR